MLNRRSIILALLSSSVLLSAAEKDVLLSPIIVTASASGGEQKPSSAPASVTVISKDEISSSGSTSLADIVKDVEGVSIVGGYKSGEISIRGMDPSSTLILVDGRRQNTRASNPKGWLAEGLQSNQIPPISAIERIEIIRGPMSSLYGSEAMGGVINIITKKRSGVWGGSVGFDTMQPQDNSYGERYQGDFYLSGPVYGEYLFSQIWGYKKIKNEDNFIDGSRGSDRQNLNIRFIFTPQANHDLSFEAGKSKQTMFQTADKTIDNTGSDARRYAQTNYFNRENFALGYRGKYEWGRLESNVYQEKSSREGTLETWFPESENTVVDLKSTIFFSENIMTIGSQWKKEEIKTETGYASSSGVGGASSDSIEKSIFLEGELSITDHLTLVSGLRLDDNHFFGKHWSPRLYVVYDIGDGWTVKGGYAKGFKNPTLAQIDPSMGEPKPWQNPNGYIWGNPSLKPEESNNYELGLYYDPLSSPLSFNVTLFRTNFTNKIIHTMGKFFYDANGNIVRDSSGLPWSTYFNVWGATIQGTEVSAKYTATPQLNFLLKYTFTDSAMDMKNAIIKDSQGNVNSDFKYLDGKSLIGTPRHKIYGKSEVKLNPNSSVFSSLTWHSGESNLEWNRVGDYKEWDESLLTMDVGGSYQLSKTFSFHAAIYNLTNSKRKQSDGGYFYPEEGRRFWSGIRAEF